jgi:hypothetical protein
MQSQPNVPAKEERRSLRDIQAEEAELQAEVEFMKWWTAEEERIRLENEAIAASLLQQQQQPPPPKRQQHRGGGKGKKSAAATDGKSTLNSKTPHREEQRHKMEDRVPSDGKGKRRF